MSLYRNFEKSKKLTNEGAKVKFPANEDGTIPTFIIARSHTSNQLYAAAVAKHYTPEFTARLPAMPDLEARAATIKVFLEANLMGWENVSDRDGEPLKFTQENAEQLFLDLPDVFEICQSFAQNGANYLKTAEEQAVKN